MKSHLWDPQCSSCPLVAPKRFQTAAADRWDAGASRPPRDLIEMDTWHCVEPYASGKPPLLNPENNKERACCRCPPNESNHLRSLDSVVSLPNLGVRSVLELPRNQVNHVALALSGAVHEQQARLPSSGIAERLPAVDLDHAGLVLERDEDGAVRRLGKLSQRHVADEPRLSVIVVFELMPERKN
jgi:hypothetical protein